MQAVTHLGLALTKILYVLLYARIFSSRQRRLLLWVIGGLILLWTVAVLSVMVARCSPIEKVTVNFYRRKFVNRFRCLWGSELMSTKGLARGSSWELYQLQKSLVHPSCTGCGVHHGLILSSNCVCCKATHEPFAKGSPGMCIGHWCRVSQPMLTSWDSTDPRTLPETLLQVFSGCGHVSTLTVI